MAEKYRKENREKLREIHSKYRENNKEILRHRFAEFYKKHRARRLAAVLARQSTPEGRAAANKRQKNYSRTKKGKEVRAKNNELRIFRINLATPKWLTAVEKKDISNIYQTARLAKLRVDHIIPITNDFVCGLNVPWNLQLLTPEENGKKSNKFDGTYNNETWKRGPK
jgi:5-methylcytosine-specific restriction endonuclease McrA